MPTTEPFKKVPVRVSMGLGHESGRGSRWMIRVEDESSGRLILALNLAPEAFGLAVGASSGQKAEGEVWDTYEALGMVAENKTIAVPELGDRWGDWDDLVGPHEIDGWKADDFDRRSYRGGMNRHRRNPDGSYDVIFRRLVPPT